MFVQVTKNYSFWLDQKSNSMNNNVPLAFVCGAVTAAFLLRTNKFRRHKWSSNDRDWVCVTKSPILLTELHERVASPKAGAVVTFSGVTRDNFDGREVNSS